MDTDKSQPDSSGQLNSKARAAMAITAVTNTVLSQLIRKWEEEGERCGEIGREADEEWDDTGDQWRERRAVYFDCARELKAAMLKIPAASLES